MVRMTDDRWIGTLWALAISVLLLAALASSWVLAGVALLAAVGAGVTTVAWRAGRLEGPPRGRLAGRAGTRTAAEDDPDYEDEA